MQRLGALCVASTLSLVLVGCGNKKKHEVPPPSPEVTGLAAVPSTAQVVIGADVSKLSGSPIVERAVQQLLLRDPKLAESWARVQDSCKIDLTKQVRHVMLALGPPAEGAALGTGPVLMVATGTLSEPDLASCIRTMVGKGGGALTAKTVSGRSIYQVKDGNRTMYFAFSRPDTVVLGTSDTWVVDALGTGPKALDNPQLKGWLSMTDQHSPLWAAGKIDDRIRSGLVDASGGKLSGGPVAIVASVDPTEGAKIAVGAVMMNAADAKSLQSFAESELKVFGMVAQAKSLGSVVSKVTVTTEGDVVRFLAPLGFAEVNQLLSVLDEKPAPEQGSPPPAPK